MKKLLVVLLILVTLILISVIGFGCGRSKLSGTYEGTLPAADCPGLQTVITLNDDGTFHMEEVYLEENVEPIITDGKWVLDGDIITFTSGDYQFEYKIISDKEIRWAPGGEEITGTDLNWSLFKK
ncbi:MAG: copper resistance protein NlpE N-terminal domain-containing protein [Actinobacteria bacterium]|nr:copper resistance protein NlpE N-terminal domain-containing protein [Actinomycetota bacterium]